MAKKEDAKRKKEETLRIMNRWLEDMARKFSWVNWSQGNERPAGALLPEDIKRILKEDGHVFNVGKLEELEIAVRTGLFNRRKILQIRSGNYQITRPKEENRHTLAIRWARITGGNPEEYEAILTTMMDKHNQEMEAQRKGYWERVYA